MADSPTGERLAAIEERTKSLQAGQKQLRDMIRDDQESRQKQCADHWTVTRKVEQGLTVHLAAMEGERRGLSLGAKVLLGCCTLVSASTGIAVALDKLVN